MRTLIATLCLLTASFPAFAAKPAPMSHLNAATMSCAEIQNRIKTDGALVARFSMPNSSMPHYGRFVSGMHYCSADELLAPETIPTADAKSCRVVECVIDR